MSSLKRTVSLPTSRALKRTRSGSKKSSRPLDKGLKRYLELRGTPKGVYEISRTVTGYFDGTPTGITIGAANYEAGTFVFSAQTILLQSGVVGNTNTWNIPNAAELAALFDKVKLDSVECTFMCTGQQAVNSGGGSLPTYLLAFDSNDRVANADSIKQMDCIAWQPGYNASMCKMKVKPQYQRLVYYTAVSSSYEPTRGYVVSDTDIPHYGLKICMNSITGFSANGHRVNFSFKLNFKCKELK